ncbi:hypothetical protein ACFWY9_18955 [Amycolatopsis sp. NPDC059027]|uniref:hypothetical protein n=1 Tax=unclassified Amycolatopsis TaxID=2618356 RepID=UPI0036706DDA
MSGRTWGFRSTRRAARLAGLAGAVVLSASGGGMAVAPSAAAAAPHSTVAGTIKWHPGHYMTSDWWHDAGTPASMAGNELQVVNTSPNVRGWKGNYYWAALETGKGVYNFSVIDAELARLNQGNPAPRKKLIIGISSSGFLHAKHQDPGGFLTKVIPSYLTTDPASYGSAPKAGTSGWWYGGGGLSITAAVWRQAVNDRLIALLQALGARYNSNPDVEGIVLTETASQVGEGGGYNDTTQLGQLERMLTAATAALPNTNVVIENNFMGNQADTSALVLFQNAHRVAESGPDLLGKTAADKFSPPKELTWGQQCVTGYPGTGCGNLTGSIAVIHNVDEPELLGTQFQGAGAPFTPLDIYNNGEDYLHASHLMWTYLTGQPVNNWPTIAAMINAHPIRFTACPKSYPGCDTR